MFGRFKVVCVTPAGRRRYLKVLVPYVLSCPIVDEYQLWRNTTDDLDTRYLYDLERASSRIHVIEPDPGPIGRIAAIGQFYRNCINTESIYIRFDDDIVYIEPDFFEKLLQFRVANPDYFLVFPNIINNAICAYIQSLQGVINPGIELYPTCMDYCAWFMPHFAEQLHRAFLKSLACGEISRWHFGPRLLALNRFSINCMTWFGKDFVSFRGKVPADEEGWLSVVKPFELMRPNCIYGDAIVAHFSFYTQRTYLDTTDILECYASLKPDIQSEDVDSRKMHGVLQPNE